MPPENITKQLFETFTQLAVACLKNGLPGYAEKICGFLVDLRRAGAWEQFEPKEREFWLAKLEDIVHPKALGDALHDHEDQSYAQAGALLRSVRLATPRAR